MKVKFKSVRLSILVGLVVLLFITPLVFYPWVTTFTITKETVAELLLLVIAALWAIWLASGRRRFSLKTPLTIPIIALAVAILLSLINTKSFFDSALGLALWGSYILAYFIVISLVDSSRWIKALLGAALSAGFLAATYCIFQFYGVDFPFWIKLGGRGRLFSTFGNPNYLAGYLIGCLPMAFVWFMSIKKRWKKLIAGILIVIPYTAVLMTYTRASWAGLLASAIFTLGVLFIFCGKRLFKENRYWLAGLTSLLLAITVIYSVPNPVNWPGRSVVGRAASSFNFGQSSLQMRFLIWLSTIEIAKEHPIIGSGIGTLGINYPEGQGEVLAQARYRHFIPQANKSINAHNDLLHMWAEIGILGLLCAAWIIIAFYTVAFRSLKRANSEQKMLLVGFMGGALAILGHSIFSFPFHVIQNGLLFWLFLGLSWVMIRKSKVQGPKSEVRNLEPKTQDPKPKTWTILRWLVPLAVIVAVAFLGMARARLFQADMYLKRGQMLIQLGNVPNAAKELEKAAKLEPHYGPIYGPLGIAYTNLGRYYDAIKAFKKAEENWIYDGLYNQLGYAYQKVGQMEEAKQAFEKNIALFPNYPDAYLNLGNMYLLQAEEQLSASEVRLAESNLDKAFFHYEQAKIFGPQLRPPTRLADDYFKIAKGGLEGEFHSNSPSFFAEDQGPLVDLLEPVARPNKPIYFKLFFYVKGMGPLPKGRAQAEGRLEVRKRGGEVIEELPLKGGGDILSALLVKGISAGEYVAAVEIRYGDKSVERKWGFTVVEEGRTLLEIAELSAAKAKPWELAIIHFTVRNNGSTPILFLGTIEIRDGAGEKVGQIQLHPTDVPPNEERKIKLSWDKRLKPGLYQAAALIVYGGNKVVKAETFFIIAPP